MLIRSNIPLATYYHINNQYKQTSKKQAVFSLKTACHFLSK
jgi:hypothetical protein